MSRNEVCSIVNSQNAGLTYISDMRIFPNLSTRWSDHLNVKGKCATLLVSIPNNRCRFYWISGTTVMSQQRGVFRVNCIDCLDRTNVVQSAFARHVLTTQMEALALLTQPGEGRTVIESVFNDGMPSTSLVNIVIE
jgi:hypothetical protein